MRTTSLEAAVGGIPDGASMMIGGFMAVGTPERLVDELRVLLDEAVAWSRREGGAAATRAVDELRAALGRDMIDGA